jgi:hypothetical protein
VPGSVARPGAAPADNEKTAKRINVSARSSSRRVLISGSPHRS